MFSPACLTYGQARSKYGPTIYSQRKLRRLLAYLCYLRHQALAILRRTVRAAIDALVATWRTPLLAATVPPRIDTSPIVRAAKEQGKEMVLSYSTPTIQPATPAPIAVATRQYVSISDTPGLARTVNVHESRDLLAAARKDHRAKWLIGSMDRWNGRAL